MVGRRAGEVGATPPPGNKPVESPARPAYREAHPLQVRLYLVPLIALDFHLAVLQGTARSTVGLQLLGQVGEVVGVCWEVEHDGDGLAPAPSLVQAHPQTGFRRDDIRNRGAGAEMLTAGRASVKVGAVGAKDQGVVGGGHGLPRHGWRRLPMGAVLDQGQAVEVLTPRTVVDVIRAGFVPGVHWSVEG